MIATENVLKPDQGTNKGFTLIETFVSITIVILGVLIVSRIMIQAMDALKKSKERMEISEKFQSFSQYLSSRPFFSEELQAGNFTRRDQHFIITWEVNDLSPGLKKITLGVQKSRMIKKAILYISKTILSVAGDIHGISFFFNLSDNPEQSNPRHPCQSDMASNNDAFLEKFT